MYGCVHTPCARGTLPWHTVSSIAISCTMTCKEFTFQPSTSCWAQATAPWTRGGWCWGEVRTCPSGLGRMDKRQKILETAGFLKCCCTSSLYLDSLLRFTNTSANHERIQFTSSALPLQLCVDNTQYCFQLFNLKSVF